MGRAPSCDKTVLKKGPWTAEEDQKLLDYIGKHGYGNWRTLPKNAGLPRCGKSCRLRWTNYLRPDIKRGRFSFEEEETIIQLHSILGNKWSAIAARLPGRTDNEIKNYWNTNIRKRLLRMGIDPVTHNPRLDLLDLSSILWSTLYNTSQMNVASGSFGAAHLLTNSELLKSLASLQNQNQNFQVFQNQYESMQASSQEVSFSNNAQIVDQFHRQNFTEFCGQSEMPSNLTGDYVPQPPSYDNFQSYNNGDGFGFASSVLSTPSSSPTTLNSNSTYINSGDRG